MQCGQAAILHHRQIGRVKYALQRVFPVESLGQVHDMAVCLRRRPDDHLGALPSRRKRLGPAVEHHLLFALRTLHCDLPHGAQDRSFLFVGGQRGQARLAGQLDIDRQAVRQPPDLFDQHRVRAGDRLGVDVAVKMVLLPQDAQSLDHQLHRAVRRAQHSAGQKQPFNIIAAVKADGQLRQLTRGEGRAGSVVGAAVDAVAAIVAAHVGVEHLQEGDAPPVRREGVADARRRTAAQCTVPSGAIHPAGGTGYIIFGAVRQDFQFFRKVHRARLLKKGYKKYSPPHILVLQGVPRAAFL